MKKKLFQSYISRIDHALDTISLNELETSIKIISNSSKNSGKIWLIGNGGSAATASHFANDIAVGTNSYKKSFRAISLADNSAIITAISNDFGYEEIFVRQLMILGRPGDVVVAISASGNSPNLIRAIEYAKKHDIKTIAITAFDGGRLKNMADDYIHVPTGPREYGPAEDAHMVIDHLVGAYLLRFINPT